MSEESCQLCQQDSTPWQHVKGHICLDCYEATQKEFKKNQELKENKNNKEK